MNFGDTHLQSGLIGHGHHSQQAAVGMRGVIVMEFILGTSFFLKDNVSKSACSSTKQMTNSSAYVRVQLIELTFGKQ